MPFGLCYEEYSGERVLRGEVYRRYTTTNLSEVILAAENCARRNPAPRYRWWVEEGTGAVGTGTVVWPAPPCACGQPDEVVDLTTMQRICQCKAIEARDRGTPTVLVGRLRSLAAIQTPARIPTRLPT